MYALASLGSPPLLHGRRLRIEKYDEILRVLDEQEDAHVQLILAKAERDAANDDSILLMNMCKGNLIGQRCRSPYIEEFELWQAALGTFDADYFQVKMEQLSCEGIDPFSTCFEAHPHCCREWPLRLLCRAATGPHAATKWAALLLQESEIVRAVTESIRSGDAEESDCEWLRVMGVRLRAWRD